MQEALVTESSGSSRIKFIIGGLLIIAAIVYLIASSTQASAQYFLTVDELEAKGADVIGRDLASPAPCLETALSTIRRPLL